MAALLPLSLIMALVLGSVQLPLSEVVASLTGNQTSSQTDTIVQRIRLPRAIMAAFIGALLAISGAVTQGLFRNPLADPSLIGVTAGASTGAALTIFFAGSWMQLQTPLGLSLVSFGAFAGGSLTVLLVYRLATSQGRTSVATMLLAGIAITALAGGLTSLLEFFANSEMLRRISLWRMGGLDGADLNRAGMAAVFAIILLSLLPRYSTALNALLLGESEARHLGIPVQSTKIKLILLVAMGVGISVALAGSIAFVGLVVPHMIRLVLGPDHRYLLPLSALGGAILLTVADCVARLVFAPIELPVGIVTALIGAPFFISLLRHRHDYGMQ
ncbi:MAG: iron ABC transporter permease [Gammaproteobacteria bacterium]|nr:iron ABC transporter permease [Gammaproteobacteria bacterium]